MAGCDRSVSYSVVVPFFNEEGNVRAVVEETLQVMSGLGREYEFVAVDDGSTDGTGRILGELLAEHPGTLRVLTAPENRGQSAAFLAGFRAAKGDVLITMDGDGQNRPEDIPKLLALLGDADMVCGWRVDRRDTPMRRWISSTANFIRRLAVRDGVHDTGCSLKVFRRDVADAFLPFHGAHRFFPAFAVQAGFRVIEEPVGHRPRRAGKTKYSFRNRGLRTLTDLFGVSWFGRRRIDLGGYRPGGKGASE